LLHFSSSFLIFSGKPHGPLEVFADNPLKAYNKIWRPAAKVLTGTDRSAFWMGALAWNGKWHPPSFYTIDNPRMPPLISSSIAALNISRKLVATRPPEPRVLSEFYKNYVKAPPEAYELKECNLQQQCSHYSTKFSFPLTARKFIFNASSRTNFERVSCAPSILVPGFQKSASSFLFYAISSHPQVLQPLVGKCIRAVLCVPALLNVFFLPFLIVLLCITMQALN
jgi:hypothetical protein